jgi:hypothetical protein
MNIRLHLQLVESKHNVYLIVIPLVTLMVQTVEIMIWRTWMMIQKNLKIPTPTMTMMTIMRTTWHTPLLSLPSPLIDPLIL